MRVRELKHRLRHLVEIDLPGFDDFTGLEGGHPPTLFLDWYSEEAVREGLERFGILAHLESQGLPPPTLELDTADPCHHTLRVRCWVDGVDALMAETSLRVGTFTTEAPFAPLLHGRPVRVLFAHWLRMQNPLAAFTPERPALPGQRHPGLGVGREVMELYRSMAQRLSTEGIAVSPEFAHTAVLYASAWHFLDPLAEGRLRALVRDVGVHDLARFSWAVDRGCVSLEGRPFLWEPEEQVLALGGPLREHLVSAAYRRAAADAERGHRFTVDDDLLRARWPLDARGAPRAGGEE